MNSEDIKKFVNSLINGVSNFLNSKGVLFEDANQLSANLLEEFSKPFIEQTKTPTQVINEYLNKYNIYKDSITPQNLGEEALREIILWGYLKTKHYE
jgi:hypothetical protein